MKLLSRPPSGVLDEHAEAAASTPAHYYRDTLARLYEVSDRAFAKPTSGPESTGEPDRTAALTTVDPEAVAAAADAPVLRAIEQLRGWLNLSYDSVARVVGFRSASLIHHWRRQHREYKPVRPRASSVERLWRVHATLRAVAEALDGTDVGYGVQLWARNTQDGLSPLDRLLADDLAGFEAAARRLLMDQTARELPSWRYARPEDDRELELPDAGHAGEYGAADFG